MLIGSPVVSLRWSSGASRRVIRHCLTVLDSRDRCGTSRIDVGFIIAPRRAAIQAWRHIGWLTTCDRMPAREAPRNMLHLMFDPNGTRPLVANWEDAARGAVRACLWESVGRIVDEKTKELLAALLSYPDVKSEWKNPIPLGFVPVIPLSLVKGDRLLNYFSVLTTVGTPQTVAPRNCASNACFQRMKRPRPFTLH
jgi:hypothetical protein